MTDIAYIQTNIFDNGKNVSGFQGKRTSRNGSIKGKGTREGKMKKKTGEKFKSICMNFFEHLHGKSDLKTDGISAQ